MSTMNTTTHKISRRQVFYKGVHVGDIVGSRTYWNGALTPQSGFDVQVKGGPNPYKAPRLPYAYFSEIVKALHNGVYDAQFEAYLTSLVGR